MFTKARPPDVYPPDDEVACPPVVNDVVPLPKVALFVYIANLKELPPGVLKSCTPSINCFLKEFVNYRNIENKVDFDLEDDLQKTQSFKKATAIYNDQQRIYLQNISLSGNIIISSDISINVSNSALLENVILIAPEITIESNVKGSFQALATKKILVKENSILQYPSVLALFEEGKEDIAGEKEPLIVISKNVQLKGVVLCEGQTKNTDYNSQLYIAENSVITGEVYCKKNLELRGTVKGSVYTEGFIVRAFGSVYVNHIYNGVIDAVAIPDQFSGLLMNPTNLSVAKWVY